MPASAALRFAKDVRQIKKAADVLTALQNAIPANDIRVAAAWYLPKSYTDHTAIVPGKTRPRFVWTSAGRPCVFSCRPLPAGNAL